MSEDHRPPIETLPLMLAALMTGYHFSISGLLLPSDSGVCRSIGKNSCGCRKRTIESPGTHDRSAERADGFSRRPLRSP